MKPTKEQLADPKWWQDNSRGYDCVFYLERNDEYLFADDNGEGINFKLIVGGAGWKLLAKRPEPEWVPEVGVECLWFSPNANCWTHTKVIAYNDSMTSAWLEGEGVVAVNSSYSQFRQIKTQREELKEIIKANLEANVGLGDIAGVILARFDLTEKEGE